MAGRKGSTFPLITPLVTMFTFGFDPDEPVLALQNVRFAVGAGPGSPLTTKGDIFGFSTVEERIPVGSDNEVLIADSTPALGVRYGLVLDANIGVHTSTKITITAKVQLNSAIVYTDQANVFGDFDQRFRNSRLIVMNPANTFGIKLESSAITADDRIARIPIINSTSTFLMGINVTNAQEARSEIRWDDNIFRIQNPARTFRYNFRTSAIVTSDKDVTLPLLIGNDVFVFQNHIQTLAGKTLITPTIASFINSTHDHEDTAGGGTLIAAAITDFDTVVSANSDVTANTAKISYTDAAAVALNTAKITNATHTGEVTGATTLTITNDAVTYAKIQNVVADNVLLGNNSGPGGIVTELTGAQVNLILPVFTSTLNGLVPLSGGGTTNFLRADGTWAVPAGGGGGQVDSVVGTTNRISVNSGDPINPIVDIDAAYVGQASITTLGTIVTGVWNGDAITGANINAALADLSDVTAKTGTGTIVVMDTSPTIITPTIASFINALHDHETAAGGGQLTATDALDATGTTDATTFLRGDNTWAVPAGGSGENNTISSVGGGTVLTAIVPKVGVDLQIVSIATTAPIAHVSATDLITFSLNPLVNADISTSAEIAVSKLADGNPGQFIRTASNGDDVEYADDIASITYIIDGGGSVLTTGVHGDLEIPFNCTIERVTLLADQTGDVEIDLFVDVFANYPPVVGDSIVAAAPPTITTDDNSQDATLTGWTTALASGSTIRYNINSVSTIQRVTIALLVRKTG